MERNSSPRWKTVEDNRKNMKKLICAVLVLALLLAIPLTMTSCKEEDKVPNYYADIEIENYGTITVKLYGQQAPITVNNFVTLAKSGFYDGLTFHRIIKGFMMQGGDPLGNGTGGSSEKIFGEFSDNGYTQNTLSHTRGVISMARNGYSYNSASSQFFIVHEDSPHLDGQYAAFGEVISGIEAVDKIASVSTDASNKPFADVVIKSITVDTKGVEYTAEKIGE